MIPKAFENDTLLAVEITRLVKEYKIASVIETGTEYGGTSVALSQMVSQVVTIDVTKQFIDTDLPTNVTFLLGDSRFLMPQAIALSRSPILFYLDAHTQNFDEECPLIEELRIIGAQSLEKPPIIVVHDSLVPNHPELGYAVYRGVPISYDAIHTQLGLIYHCASSIQKTYSHYYNSEALGAKRGVLFITPTVVDSSPCIRR